MTPLVFLRTGGEFENNPKSAVLQWGIALLALLWLARRGHGKSATWTRTPLDVGVLLFCLACLLSLIQAVNVLEATPLLLHWGAGVILYFLLIHTLHGPDAVPRFFLATAVGCGAVCLVGIGQVFLGLTWIPQSEPPASTLANRNMASHYVAICFPLALGLIAISKNVWGKTLAVWSILLSMVYLFHTQTRAAWLAVLVVIVASVAGLPWLLKKTGQAHGRKWLVYVAAVLLLAACLFGFASAGDALPSEEGIVGRLTSMADVDAGTAHLRLIFWKNTLAMARDHPLLGVGLGNFKLLYPLYHRAAAIDWTFDEEHQLEQAHNDHLQILAELGLVGFIAWVSIFAIACHATLRGVRAAQAWVPAQTFFVGLAIVAFLIVACLSFPMERAMPPVYLFALLGMSAFLHGASSGTPVTGRQLSPWIRWTGVLVLVAFLSTSVVSARRALLSDIYYTNGVRLTHADEHARAVVVLDKARRLLPHDVNTLLMLANNHVGLGHFELAIETLEDVLRFAPHKINAIANLGYCYLQVRDYEQAERYFGKSLEILPDSPQIFSNLGTAYFEQGRHDSAVDAYRTAVELAQTKPFLPGVRTDVRVLQPRLLLANAYVAQQRLVEAIEQYEEILKYSPERQDVRRLLAELYRTTGKPDRARQVLENAPRDEPR